VTNVKEVAMKPSYSAGPNADAVEQMCMVLEEPSGASWLVPVDGRAAIPRRGERIRLQDGASYEVAAVEYEFASTAPPTMLAREMPADRQYLTAARIVVRLSP
jgi:hypothetical protein